MSTTSAVSATSATPATESAPAPRARSAADGLVAHDLVSRKNLRLDRDPGRVIAKLFAPGTSPAGLEERASQIVRRILSLGDAELDAAYERMLGEFQGRHRDLEGVFEADFRAMEHRVSGDGAGLTGRRRLLVGALFSHEIALEGAALTNPSMVQHPDQSGLEADELRFVMSARAIGEGHMSLVEFRTGILGADGEIHVDPPSRYASCGVLQPTTYDRTLLAAALDRPEDDDEALAYLLRRLPERFIEKDVEEVFSELPPQLRVMAGTLKTVADAHWFMACQYRQAFAEGEDLSEHVLWPTSPSENRGMEDARFVRFTDPDGTVDYRATYTANGGATERVQMIRTADFRTFDVSQVFGPAAGHKDLALFPRTIDGAYVAMSRCDREHNAVAFSADGAIWDDATRLDLPVQPWRLMQAGNCGSPIETEAGWLVLTHGVGPMRVYSLGALLLDLRDPTKVLGVLDEPLLRVSPGDREGYVPNVVYSCGALRHGDTLAIPYGFGDMGIEFATASVTGLLDALK